MRFKLGAAIGFVAGYLAAAKASDDRRRQVDDAIQRVRENPRVRHVSEVVSRDAKRIGDAVEDRFAKTADNVVESVATTVEPESSGSSDTSTSSSTSSPSTGTTSTNAATRSAR
jgi:gas vesicle protein